MKFGRLTLISDPALSVWTCMCDCGKIKTIRRKHVKAGKTISCGCARNDAIALVNKTHGATCGRRHSPEYTSWAEMKTRCNNQNRESYKNYGGRGIKVCKRWNSFANFLKDMGAKPPKSTLERKNNNKGYSPSNCIWATRSQQAQNTRRCCYLELGGLKLSKSEWARKIGVNRTTITARLKAGLTAKEALTLKKWSIDYNE